MAKVALTSLFIIGRSVAWFIGLLIGSVILGWAVQHITLLLQLDTYSYRAIFLGPHFRIIDLMAQPFNYNLLFHIPGIPADMPTFFYFMILGVSIYLWRTEPKKLPWFLASIVMGNLLVHLVSLIDTHLVYRVRPFIALNLPIDQTAYMAWKDLSAYPSGHCRDTALYSSLIAYFVPKLKWPALLLILFIMFTRIYMGAHYPSDVVAGSLIGCGVATIIWQASKSLQARGQDF